MAQASVYADGKGMHGSAQTGSEQNTSPSDGKTRFWNLPVFTLVAMSFMLGMSEFIVVGILPDVARGLSVSEVAVGNLVSIFAFVYAPATPIGSAVER
ncbi:hypothetical protein PT275_00795 [Bifidobacterium sp. ESL0745]|nr:hypothetical protein [Bifidobacterium sp. ESL0745]MDF7664658.1 hypothetical protein [Bifidobacterium sp. ESL0745]